MDWTGLVKHGLDSKAPISKTWTGPLDSFSKTWTGLKSARLVKHGLDSFSKTWTGLV